MTAWSWFGLSKMLGQHRTKVLGLRWKGNARSKMVFKLAAPRPIVLPKGPRTNPTLNFVEPEVCSQETLDDFYGEWASKFEDQVLTFLAVDKKEAKQFLGRNAAPEAVWRTALGPPGGTISSRALRPGGGS